MHCKLTRPLGLDKCTYRQHLSVNTYMGQILSCNKNVRHVSNQPPLAVQGQRRSAMACPQDDKVDHDTLDASCRTHIEEI